MSCLDKLMRCNIVGIQGSLMTKFIDPVYYSSIIIGEQFNRDQLYQALTERIADEMCNSRLPDPFKFNVPQLYQVKRTSVASLTPPSAPNYSVHWNIPSYSVEYVSGATGKVLEDEKVYSRLSKRAFFVRYWRLGKDLGYEDMKQPSNMNYTISKQRMAEYQQAKVTFFDACEQSGIGKWVVKPYNVDNFPYSRAPTPQLNRTIQRFKSAPSLTLGCFISKAD